MRHLHFLVDLVVTSGSSYQMYHCVDERADSFQCPLTSLHLEKFLFNTSTFMSMEFTPEESRLLARRRMRHLCLEECSFLDDGAAFADEREQLRSHLSGNEDSNPETLRVASTSMSQFPFGAEHWRRLISTLKSSAGLEVECFRSSEVMFQHLPRILEFSFRCDVADNIAGLVATIDAPALG